MQFLRMRLMIALASRAWLIVGKLGIGVDVSTGGAYAQGVLALARAADPDAD